MSVTPQGREVVVASSFNSNGGAYHAPGCELVGRMKSPRRVDVSVAEWKNLEACQRCGGE